MKQLTASTSYLQKCAHIGPNRLGKVAFRKVLPYKVRKEANVMQRMRKSLLNNPRLPAYDEDRVSCRRLKTNNYYYTLLAMLNVLVFKWFSFSPWETNQNQVSRNYK